ncbi:MAG: rhodanese-like domain-containing protein [Acidimicrobiales bacterium]
MDVPEVDPAEAIRLLDDGAVLLDVREDDEWAEGRSPRATHIRLSELPGRVAELPRDRTVVAICHLGGRSHRAATFLLAQGLTAVNVTGGMKAWIDGGHAVVTETGEPGTVS